MNYTFTTVLVLHVFVCLVMILVVLIQSGKGAGLSNIFGTSGGGDSLFSAPSGSSFMRKLTTGLAAAFFVLSLVLTILSAKRNSGMSTVTRNMWTPPAPSEAPVAPAAEPAAPSAPPATPAKVPPKSDK